MKSAFSLFSSVSWLRYLSHLRHYAIAILIFFFGLFLSFAAFRFYQTQNMNRAHAEFDRIADLRLLLIEDTLLETLEQIKHIKQFFYASSKVTRNDFNIYVRTIFHHFPNFLFLGLIEANPLIDQKVKSSEGLEFISLNPNEAARTYFVPFTYLEMATPLHSFYVDASAYQMFLDLLKNSHQSNTVSVSDSAAYMSDEKKLGFFFLLPIFYNKQENAISKKGLFGTIVGFSNFESVVKNVRSRLEPMGINISIYDETNGKDHLLYWNGATVLQDPSHLTREEQQIQEQWRRSHTLQLGNRTWKLMATPTLDFVRTHQNRYWNHWEVPIIGILGSALTALYFLALVNRRMLIEQEVHERTIELANINDILQLEIHERQRIEEDILANHRYTQRRQEALEYLTKLTISDFRDVIHEVILRTATVMQVDRVSVWLYKIVDNNEILACNGLYILSTNSFSNQMELTSLHFPRYFQALSKHSHLIFPSTHDADLNHELSSYLAAFCIQSKLDIPVVFEGNLLGILSCEETRGHREWLLEDRHFGQTISDIVAIIIEQSARRKAEKALQVSEERLRIKEKSLIKALQDSKAANEAKSEFLATISHELRSPLNAIIGFDQCILMGMDGPINDSQRMSLIKIEKSSFHLLDLINHILDWSKIEAKKMELEITSQNIVELIHLCVEEMQPLAQKKKLEISLSIDKPFILLEIDKVRIQQVILNLLSNAIKFTEKGTIKVELLDEPQHVILRVSDTGIGLSQEEMEKIFHPFSQADSSITRKFGGTGLGLVISRNIVQLHGGTITVESQKGIGSTFIVNLPKKISSLLILFKN